MGLDLRLYLDEAGGAYPVALPVAGDPFGWLRVEGVHLFRQDELWPDFQAVGAAGSDVPLATWYDEEGLISDASDERGFLRALHQDANVLLWWT